VASRFHGRSRLGGVPNRDSERQTGFGEWWAAIAVLALSAMVITSISGNPGTSPPLSTESESVPVLLEAIQPAAKSLVEIERAFSALCVEPVLVALELAPDCETGVITLPDSFFNSFGSSSLAPEFQEDVAAAMRIYLRRLRQLPALWDSLQAVEIRGHTDPRALRRPYTTNLVVSQQHPIALLLFLMGPRGLASEDKLDLQRLAVVSGSSFSRPPKSCPESTRECYPKWRRVEIRPVLSESLRRADWSRTLEDVRETARRIQQEDQPKKP
jgi:outer membrane protein OmpA-like peptidoglycan-associated protein